MAAYLSFDEYTDMGGTLDETAFDELEYSAESYVDWYTFNRLRNETEIPEQVKKCIFYIMRLLQKRMEYMTPDDDSTEATSNSAKQIASQSNDGVSVHYNILYAEDVLTLVKDEVDITIKRYMQGLTNSLGRKLLYRGIYPDE